MRANACSTSCFEIRTDRLPWSGVPRCPEDAPMTRDPLAPIHPGEILREEFLGPLELSPYALAAALRVPRTRVERLVREQTAGHTRHGFAARPLLRHDPRILARHSSALRCRDGAPEPRRRHCGHQTAQDCVSCCAVAVQQARPQPPGSDNSSENSYADSMARTSKRAVVGRMKAKGFEHIKILKPAVEPSKAQAAKIRAAVRAFYRDRAAAK